MLPFKTNSGISGLVKVLSPGTTLLRALESDIGNVTKLPVKVNSGISGLVKVLSPGTTLLKLLDIDIGNVEMFPLRTNSGLLLVKERLLIIVLPLENNANSGISVTE